MALRFIKPVNQNTGPVSGPDFGFNKVQIGAKKNEIQIK
jgi:hypothetical protein